MPWDPSEDGSDRKQRQSASSHPHSHAGLICLLLSLVLRARLAGLASNTLAPLKDVSSLLAGSTPTSSNHQQVQASDPHKKVLLFLADAYGPLFINNKLLQDYFASRGMSVPIGMHAVRCHLYETESQDSSYSVQIIFSGFPYRICHPIVTRSHGLARHSPQQ